MIRRVLFCFLLLTSGSLFAAEKAFLEVAKNLSEEQLSLPGLRVAVFNLVKVVYKEQLCQFPPSKAHSKTVARAMLLINESRKEAYKEKLVEAIYSTISSLDIVFNQKNENGDDDKKNFKRWKNLREKFFSGNKKLTFDMFVEKKLPTDEVMQMLSALRSEIEEAIRSVNNWIPEVLDKEEEGEKKIIEGWKALSARLHDADGNLLDAETLATQKSNEIESLFKDWYYQLIPNDDDDDDDAPMPEVKSLLSAEKMRVESEEARLLLLEEEQLRETLERSMQEQ